MDAVTIDQKPARQPAASPRQVPHFVALDSLRGIAALSVVLHHLTWHSAIEDSGYATNSYLMVDLFFVLSGFVIFYAYGERIRSAVTLSRFLWLRFWRLYPLHVALLIVFLGIECLKALVQWRWGIVANNPAFSTNNFSAFAGNVFLIQSLGFYRALTYNYPAWSISVEFYTYILFAAVVLALGSKRAILAGAALICVLAFGGLILLGPQAETLTVDFGIVRCVAGFFLGVLTFAAYDHLQSVRSVRAHAGPIGYCAAAAIGVFALFIAFKSRGYCDLAIYPLSAAVILAVAQAPPRFLGAAPLVWLGTVSYSIYMVHAAVIWGVNQVLRFATHAKEIRLPLHDTPVLDADPVVGLGAAVIAVALVLIVSHLTFAWIEKPFRDWSKSAPRFAGARQPA